MSKPVINPPASPVNLVVGVDIAPMIITANFPIVATTWSASNLPAGLTISMGSQTNPYNTWGIIQGRPTSAGVTTATITASNADGTSDPVTIVFNVAGAPNGSGATSGTSLSPWSDFVLTIDQGTRKVTAPGVAPMESGAIFSIARGDVIDLLVGLEKYGVLADLGATVTVEVAPKEFEAEAVLNLTSAVATRVQTSSLADTTRYRVRLTMTAANYAILADYATETEAAMIAPVQVRMIAGSKLICSDTFLVEILRDAVPD